MQSCKQLLFFSHKRHYNSILFRLLPCIRIQCLYPSLTSQKRTVLLFTSSVGKHSFTQENRQKTLFFLFDAGFYPLLGK